MLEPPGSPSVRSGEEQNGRGDEQDEERAGDPAHEVGRQRRVTFYSERASNRVVGINRVLPRRVRSGGLPSEHSLSRFLLLRSEWRSSARSPQSGLQTTGKKSPSRVGSRTYETSAGSPSSSSARGVARSRPQPRKKRMKLSSTTPPRSSARPSSPCMGPSSRTRRGETGGSS